MNNVWRGVVPPPGFEPGPKSPYQGFALSVELRGHYATPPYQAIRLALSALIVDAAAAPAVLHVRQR